MKKSVAVITVIFVFALLCCIAVFPVVYRSCFCYKTDTGNELNQYFQSALKPDVFKEGTDVYNKYYDFNYGDAVMQIAALNYEPVEKETALDMLLRESFPENSYQVYTYWYSDQQQPAFIVNLLYFSLNDNNYMLAYYYDDDSKSGKSFTLYSVKGELPSILNRIEFKGHDLFRRCKDYAKRTALKKVGAVMLPVTVIYVFGILFIKNKDNKDMMKRLTAAFIAIAVAAVILDSAHFIKQNRSSQHEKELNSAAYAVF